VSECLHKQPDCPSQDGTEFGRSLHDLMPKLARYAQSLARNPDNAQDLVQETMLKAWRSRESFVVGTNFKAWTFRILRSSFLSQVRRASVVQISGCGELSDIPVASNQETFVTLNDVRRLWARLTPEQRRCIQFVGIDGLS
jgi:RNA polymerase sigma-70 factor (ECF subfamily)